MSNPSKFKLDPRMNTVDQIYHGLREAIVSLEWHPGQRVREKDLCERFGTSRTPLREAMILLAQDGLLEVLPQRGTFVSKISMQEVREGFFLRELIETAMVRTAAESPSEALSDRLETNLQLQQRCAERQDEDGLYPLDQDFHRALSEANYSERVWRIISLAKLQLDRMRRLSYPIPGYLDTIVSQHQAIANAVLSANPVQAVQAMRDHLSDVIHKMEALKREHREFFTE
jgi:DNA-binding GntR family transcriptional regulator